MFKDFMIIADMEDYLSARESQAHLYKDVPLYCRYKKRGAVLDPPRLDEKKLIQKSDEAAAVSELVSSLNTSLARQTLANDFTGVRTALNLIVEEAFEYADTQVFIAIPETIDVLFEAFLKIKTTSGIEPEYPPMASKH